MSTYLIENGTRQVYEVEADNSGCRIPCVFHNGTHKNLQIGPGEGFYCYKCKAKGLALDHTKYMEWQQKQHQDSHHSSAPVDKEQEIKVSPNSQQKESPVILWNDIVREHVYADADGKPIYKKSYYRNSDGSKQPLQYRFEADEWQLGLTYKNGTKVQAVPYNLGNVLDPDCIIYTEGEKDCDTLIALGITNVTTLGGANSKLLAIGWLLPVPEGLTMT